jgi:hypothetical protein
MNAEGQRPQIRAGFLVFMKEKPILEKGLVTCYNEKVSSTVVTIIYAKYEFNTQILSSRENY